MLPPNPPVEGVGPLQQGLRRYQIRGLVARTRVEGVGPLQQGLRRPHLRTGQRKRKVEGVGPLQQGLRPFGSVFTHLKCPESKE